MAEILLISEEMLKLYSPMGRNVDAGKVLPFVVIAQTLDLQPVLGQDLTQELQEQVASGEITPANKALLLKLAPYLALDSTFLALRSLAYSVGEKGITKESSDNSDALGSKELGEWKTELMALKEQARDMLLDYLCGCSEAYPTWRPSDPCLCKRRKGREDGITSLVYLPKRGCSCGCD